MVSSSREQANFNADISIIQFERGGKDKPAARQKKAYRDTEADIRALQGQRHAPEARRQLVDAAAFRVHQHDDADAVRG